MADDPLDTVLRLVAEGRLTADEAGPILAALDAKAAPAPSDGRAAAASSGERQGPSATGAKSAHGSGGGGAAADEPATGAAAGRSLRVEVRDEGRTVVNLRLPLALGRYAIDRIPGLSGEQVDRVRDALSSGMTGPVLVVDDEHGGVRITID
jgi:hypothetical protein